MKDATAVRIAAGRVRRGDVTGAHSVLTRQATEPLVPCPACAGQGEFGTHQDYWGNWDTEQCRACDGMTEVTTDRAAEIRDEFAEGAPV